MPNPTILCEAISKRQLLEFRYHGLRRLVEPYCHGISTRGVEVLRAVQVGGKSSSGGFGFGKLWTVADIEDLHLVDETFPADDPHYNPDDTGMKSIHCRVQIAR